MISLYSPKSEFMLAAAEIAKAGLMNERVAEKIAEKTNLERI